MAGIRFGRGAALAAAVMAAGTVAAADAAPLVSDTLTNGTETGGLGGSAPDTTGSGTWTSYYLNNGGELVPANGQLTATTATFSTTTGTAPNTPARGATGTNFGASTSHTDVGGNFSVTPAATGVITETTSLNFASNAATANPTAWSFIGLSVQATPGGISDPFSGLGPWLLIRPALAGGDYAELYATTGTGTRVATLTAIPATDGGVWGPSHTLSLVFDPAAGTLDALVDGTTILATPYQYGGANPPIPVITGVGIGDRTNTGQASAGNPSSVTFSNFSLSQAPEPASLGLLSTGGLLLLRRRKTHG